jgi:catechol 2,3-dioxygenase-like lactoylglutathione lyase family enzyme
VSRLDQTIPAMPVRKVAKAVDFYRDRLGFEVLHHDGGFAVLRRDEAVLHLWQAGDESWRTRASGEIHESHESPESPVCSGAESCIVVEGVDELYDELRAADVLHKVSQDGVDDTDFGTREFATLDSDGNLVTFFQWVER